MRMLHSGPDGLPDCSRLDVKYWYLYKTMMIEETRRIDLYPATLMLADGWWSRSELVEIFWKTLL